MPTTKVKRSRPAQKQKRQPGKTAEMQPKPADHMEHYKSAGKLAGMVAIVTGGDSGIGRAVSIAFAKEGADVAIVYFDEDEDAKETISAVEREGRQALLFRGDVGDEEFCEHIVEETIDQLGSIDILINNAAEQHARPSIMDISDENLEQIFRTNIFSMFLMSKAVLRHISHGGCIINTTSVTAYKGQPRLLDYSCTKGAIVAFTRSLSQSKEILEKNIRVNAVAPGPVWTPLIPSTGFDAEAMKEFGSDVPLGRAGQPDEIAPCYVFLASDDASYMTGQVMHPNGGEIVNG